MVGLKAFWILAFTLLFASCVPMTKQSECGANQAFDPTSRTCISTGGQTGSQVYIPGGTPAGGINKTKLDTTPIALSISDPVGVGSQPYTIAWEHTFQSGTTGIGSCSNNKNCTFQAPINLQTGFHTVTAKILINSSTVATHAFLITINENPQVSIIETSIIPSSTNYVVTVLKSAPARPEFSFRVKNNVSISTMDNWRIEWKLTAPSGHTVPGSSTTTTITNGASGYETPTQFGTSLTPAFDHTTFPVGRYGLVATVIKNMTPVAVKNWTIDLEHPALGHITTIQTPAPGVETVAYHGLSADQYPIHNWIYGSPSAQPQYCMTFNKATGSYSGLSGDSILVKFYLDGIGGEVCTKKTNPVGPDIQTVCLMDANPCVGQVDPSTVSVPPLLKFLNPSANVEYVHHVTARVFDEAASQEYAQANVLPLDGSYPLKWKVLTKPVNVKPTLSFGASTNLTNCSQVSATEVDNCKVTQGDLFTVRFNYTDDFHTASEEFSWTVRLKSNTSDIAVHNHLTSCQKLLGVPGVAECQLQVPHYTNQGSLHPAGPFSVVATLSDSGSPVGGSPKSADPITWKLDVKEANTPVETQTQVANNLGAHISRDTPLPVIVLDPAGTNSVQEKEKIMFHLGVRDAELDDFVYRIYRCGPGSTSGDCKSAGAELITNTWEDYIRLAKPAVDLTTFNPVMDFLLFNAFEYTLPENLLLTLGVDIPLTSSAPVFFEVVVEDRPSTSVVLPTQDKKVFALNVSPYNPAPVITPAGAAPATNTVASPYPVMGGYQFSINPGTVTDASLNSPANEIVYRWYARECVSGTCSAAWESISNATNKDLLWTPDHTITNIIELRLCVGDNTQANPVGSPDIPGSVCSPGSWFIQPLSYLVNYPSVTTNTVSDVAVWFDDQQIDTTQDVIYSAFIDDTAKTVHVNKTVRRNDLSMDTTVSTVSFPVLSSGSTSKVSNLSITGTAESLYISYLASPTGTPDVLYPRLRRISKAFDVNPTSNTFGYKSALSHQAPFGFSYTEPAMTSSVAPPDVTITSGTGSTSPQIEFTVAIVTPGETVAIGSESFTITGGTITEHAENLALAINTSSSLTLQGITAISSGGAVTLLGNLGYEDITLSSYPVVENGLGKIFIQGSQWYIPSINASSGTFQNHVQIISGTTDVKLANSASVSVDYSPAIATLGAVARIDTKVNHLGELVIAGISSAVSNSGQVKLARYNLISNNVLAHGNIFSGKLFEKINLSANASGNNSIYMMATERTTGDIYLGRYPTDITSSSVEHLLEDRLNLSDYTSHYIDNEKLKNPVIVAVPNSSEARIFFNSEDSPSGPLSTRLARWRSNDTLSCGQCMPIGLANTTSPVAVSQIIPDFEIGIHGFDMNENIKDVLYFISNHGAGNSTQIGHINIEPEAIQSTTVDVNHKWRPPFVK